MEESKQRERKLLSLTLFLLSSSLFTFLHALFYFPPRLSLSFTLFLMGRKCDKVRKYIANFWSKISEQKYKNNQIFFLP